MKLLFLLVGLGLPMLVKAQELVPKKVLPDKPISVAEALENSINPHFKVLKRLTTPVYHTPADTLNNRFAMKLGPGTRVYIRKYIAQGFIVTLTFGDGEEYYLPYKLVAELPTQVEI
jgi:hypothetical protein